LESVTVPCNIDVVSPINFAQQTRYWANSEAGVHVMDSLALMWQTDPMAQLSGYALLF
jgi:hypothetical protein